MTSVMQTSLSRPDVVAWCDDGGAEWCVHRSGLRHHTDHLGRSVVLVHIRVSERGRRGRARSIMLRWRPDTGRWVRDDYDRLADVPGDFCDDIEDMLAMLRGPEDRFL